MHLGNLILESPANSFSIHFHSNKHQMSAVVDGTDVRNSSHELAVQTIKNAGEKMTIIVQSFNTGVSLHCKNFESCK